jgi:hypothetical protein
MGRCGKLGQKHTKKRCLRTKHADRIINAPWAPVPSTIGRISREESFNMWIKGLTHPSIITPIMRVPPGRLVRGSRSVLLFRSGCRSPRRFLHLDLIPRTGSSFYAEPQRLVAEQCGNNLPFCDKLDQFQMERARFSALKLSEGNIGTKSPLSVDLDVAAT